MSVVTELCMSWLLAHVKWNGYVHGMNNIFLLINYAMIIVYVYQQMHTNYYIKLHIIYIYIHCVYICVCVGGWVCVCEPSWVFQ
jgi:hypothetical protein